MTRAQTPSWVEEVLASAPDEPAPGDGLARVMAEIDRGPQPAARRPMGAGAVAASLVGVAVAAGAIGWGSAWLLGASRLFGVGLPALGPAASLGLAALCFFSAGSFATLALAPVLMLESARRPLAARR